MSGAGGWVVGEDALVANAFKVTIEGEAIHVKEVTGLKREFDMIEVKTQTATGTYVLRKIPGREKPVTLTITRSLTNDDRFSTWMDAIKMGAVLRKKVIVDVLTPGDMSKPVQTFTISNCQPSAVEITQVQAGAANALDEKITLQGWEMEVKKG